MGRMLSKSCKLWRTICWELATCVYRDLDDLVGYVMIGAYSVSFVGAAGLALAMFTHRESPKQAREDTVSGLWTDRSVCVLLSMLSDVPV